LSVFIIAKLALAAAVVLAAAVYDVRTRRIPNWLTLTGVLTGIVVNLAHLGVEGLTIALLGLGLAMLVYFPMWMLRAMGAGDVKLMAAIGALIGPRDWFLVFLLTAVYAGIAGFAYAASKGHLGRVFGNVGKLVAALARFRAPYLEHKQLSVASPEALRLPHGASIALGYLTFAVLVAFRFSVSA
jgi:prepilin peptidase CpaA